MDRIGIKVLVICFAVFSACGIRSKKTQKNINFGANCACVRLDIYSSILSCDN